MRLIIRLAASCAAAAFAAALPPAHAMPAQMTDRPVAPPLPPLRALELLPAPIEIHDGRDARKVLVTGVAADGQRFDLTASAVFKPDSDALVIDADGYIAGLRAGAARVSVSAAGLSASLPVYVRNADTPPVGFVRDVMPVLARAGCNSGPCHGAAQGKNGFRLTLRGYDPDVDYEALVFELSGRRINRVLPDQSLMVLKPTAAVPHEGKQVIKPGSRYHTLLVDWIAQGTRPEPASARAVRIEVIPGDIEIDLPGRSQQVLVLAHYADGAVRDVTREAILTSSDTEIASLEGNTVTALRRGEAAVLARYEGNYATRLVTVMGDRDGFAWTDTPEHNFIDTHIHAKLRRIKALPSELCTDDEFLRRVHLDLTGVPPSAARARAFLLDPAPSREKRDRLIDELIGSDAYIDYWTNKWSDLLQCNSEALGLKGVRVFREWIRRAVAENRPYDRFVRDLLIAEGSCYENPAANYLRVLREPDKITEDVTQTFLGTRFNCCKCHDHPFERWTQNQYYQIGAYFARVAIKKGTLGQESALVTGAIVNVTGEEIVYRKPDGGEVSHPKTTMKVDPKVPYGDTPPVPGEGDRREPFVDWLVSPDNPLFAKSMANRVWSYFLGRGIIHPVDDIRSGNPPSNPELLDALTADFVEGGFDVRRLMRTICRSRAYQRSIAAHRWNEDDTVNFSHAIPRRLTAEQMLDAIAAATGHRPTFPGVPAGARAAELPDGITTGNDFLTLFGRPKRKSSCECERSDNITLSHTMNLINGPAVGDALAAPGNRIAKLVESQTDDRAVAEELYLAILSRFPTEEELAAADPPVGAPRLDAAQDLAWALINSPAFLFNR